MSGSDGDHEVPLPAPHEHVDGALLLSFGEIHPGREAVAVEAFRSLARFFGRLLSEGEITEFKPYFFADGPLGDTLGFFLVEGRRERLDELRRDEDFRRAHLRMGAASANVRVNTMAAGSEAGRLANLFGEVREELGLL
ncbi:MAG TPA: hypothetical protein VF230_08710 [Acidimicrobiales bacterium]